MSEPQETGRPDWLAKLPKPSPDMNLYRAELEAALALSPACRDNYTCFRASKRQAEIGYSPVKMDIENVSRCNFRCPKCPVSTWQHGRRAEDLSFDSFRQVLDQFPGLVEMKLQGLGEPLLGGDEYFEMIRYARRRRIWVRTTTNASLLHHNDNYKGLIDSDPNEVQISVDGATSESLEAIRQGAKFELTAANCRLINDYCRSLGVVKTRMWTCIERENVRELMDLVVLADELGFTRLSFALDLHGWGVEELEQRNRDRHAFELLEESAVAEAINLGKSLGVEISFWANTDSYSTDSGESLCPWPFERAFISSDLRIVPCCIISDPSIADLGDARAFHESWHGDVYRKFRHTHLSGQIPHFCQSCYAETEGGNE